MAPEHYSAVFKSPIGKLGLLTNNEQLQRIDFLDDNVPAVSFQNIFLKDIEKQLNAYFKNPHHLFTIPLNTEQGSEFAQSVWKALQKIPVGQTRYYSELASQVGTSARAIGNACRINPFPILIPCHRVIAKNHAGGYMGATSGKWLIIKQWLLQHDGIVL